MGARRLPRPSNPHLLIFDDDRASHPRVDGAEILVLTGRFEFVRKPVIGVEWLRNERTVYFGDLMRLLVFVDPSYLRTDWYRQITRSEHKVLDVDCV